MADETLPRIPRGEEPAPEHLADYFKHACPPTWGGPNPDPISATFTFRRDLLDTLNLPVPGGDDVKIWIIRDPDDGDNGRQFPSKTVRIPQGAIVKADVDCSGGTHTIHWHGIEPSPMNDGVGKHSFEVSGHFPYQFQPRDAGTYFYHCHKNTVLHFEMGLYGLLLIDPPDPAAPNVPVTWPNGGPGFAARFNPLALAPTDHAIRYDVEAFWVPDDIDRRWHELNHDAYMQACDADDPVNPADFRRDGILNDFDPDIFLLTGVPRRREDATPFTPANSPALVAPTLRAGETLLIRVLNASYTTTEFSLDHPVEVIAMDGRALGVPPFMQYSHPFTVAAGIPFRLTTAMRWDLLVRPVAAADIHATVKYRHSVTGRVLYTAGMTIAVVP